MSTALLRHVLKLIGTAIHVDTLTKGLTNVLELNFNILDLDMLHLHLGNFSLRHITHVESRLPILICIQFFKFQILSTMNYRGLTNSWLIPKNPC